jgi:hypothetical protein
MHYDRLESDSNGKRVKKKIEKEKEEERRGTVLR